MNLFESIKRNIAIRINELNKRRAQKAKNKAIIDKYNLNDAFERQSIIEKYILIQKNEGAFGRKTRLHIEDKIKFMIANGLIKVIE